MVEDRDPLCVGQGLPPHVPGADQMDPSLYTQGSRNVRVVVVTFKCRTSVGGTRDDLWTHSQVALWAIPKLVPGGAASTLTASSSIMHNRDIVCMNVSQCSGAGSSVFRAPSMLRARGPARSARRRLRPLAPASAAVEPRSLSICRGKLPIAAMHYTICLVVWHRFVRFTTYNDTKHPRRGRDRILISPQPPPTARHHMLWYRTPGTL